MVALHDSTNIAGCVAAAAFELQHRGMGAVIIIGAGAPLEPHLTRGFTAVDDEITTEVLLTALDYGEAPFGVAIEAGRLTMKDVVLPFDAGLVPGPEYGSRHTCARTLSARLDALVVVISEERQNVVIFDDGKMTEMRAADQLEATIVEHLVSTCS
jgi:DNA integrity scanning protein DisA with diadenylate cyclase activity